MRITTLRELRRRLAATNDSVNADHEPVVVTRGEGRPAAVLMSVEDFAALEETAHLLRSPRNAERLARSIADLERGLETEHEMTE